MIDLLAVGVRISVMYVYVLGMMRLSGKRTVGDMSPHDFIVALMLGDLFDDVIWAEVPLAQGLVAVATLIVWSLLTAFAEYRSNKVHALASSTPSVVIKNGKWVRQGMLREREREEEIREELRSKGVSHMGMVGTARYEPSGDFSLIKTEWAKEAQKQDLPALKRLLRKGDKHA